MLVTLLPPNDADVEHDNIAECGGDLRRSQEMPICTPTRHPGLGQARTRKTSSRIRCCVSPVSIVGEGNHHIAPISIYEQVCQLKLTYHDKESMCVPVVG